MLKKEVLIKKLYNKECSSEELQLLFDMLEKDNAVDIGLMKTLWEQLEDYPKFKEKTSQQLFDSIQSKKKISKIKEAKIVQFPLFRRRQFFKIASVAAVLSILMLAAIWQWSSLVSTTILATAFAEQKSFELPDGSTVTLNANSTLKYDARKPRKVWLEGEAFFEIKKIPSTQENFQVFTPDLKVMVLGTSFNINARNNQTKVFLEEGKVDIEIEDSTMEIIKMNPGDLITYSKKQKELKEKRKNVSVLENASWKEGTLTFNHTPLTQALYEIEAIYGIQFRLQSEKLKKETISGGVPIKNLKVTLQILREVYGIKIKVEEKRYYIMGMQE